MAQDLRAPRRRGPDAADARGDARAFEVVYERHSAAAFSLAYRMVGTRAVAEDVTQEAFLNLWRSGAHYDRARGSVRTWVLGIVHHRAIDALRRATVHDRGARATRAIAERFEARERTDVEVARRDEARDRAQRDGHAARRPVKVIELAYFGGFTHIEIAEMLEAPVGTVKGRMRLGLKKMRDAARQGAVSADAVTGPDHERWEDAAGAYVLGALPDDERDGLRGPPRRLPGLPRGGRRAAAGRARRCRSPSPPMRAAAALKARIMAEVEREAELLAAAGAEADRPRPAPARSRRRPAALAALRGWRSRRSPPRCCSSASRSASAVAQLARRPRTDRAGHRRSAARAAPQAELEINGRRRRRWSPRTCPRRRGPRLQGLAQAHGARARADDGAVHAAPRRHGRRGRARALDGRRRRCWSPTSRAGGSPQPTGDPLLVADMS